MLQPMGICDGPNCWASLRGRTRIYRDGNKRFCDMLCYKSHKQHQEEHGRRKVRASRRASASVR